MIYIRIAITGGIGSGKSTVLNYLKELGFFTLSADEENKLILKNEQIKQKVRKEFGERAIVNNEIDRLFLANEIFNDNTKRNKLNNILHKEIIEIIENKIKNSKEKTVFVEIPLLFESNYQDKFDKVIVIMRNKKNRIESVSLRDNLDKDKIIQRINNQIDYDNCDFKNYCVIINDGDVYNLKQRINEIIIEFNL